jgi:hypothetical protein
VRVSSGESKSRASTPAILLSPFAEARLIGGDPTATARQPS